MRTISFYLGGGESERKRKRSKWIIPLIVGLIAAYAVAQTGATGSQPVVVPPVAPPPIDPPRRAESPSVQMAPVEIAPNPIVVPPPPPPPAPARPVFSPSRIDFGDGGRAAAQLATVRNDGGQPITLVSTTISGPFLATNGCANGVAPGAQCVVAVVFAPQEPGISSGALTIVADGKRSRIPLSGSLPRPPVVAPPPPPPTVVQAPPPIVTPARQLCFEPSKIHFRSTGKQSITLTNPERTPLRVTGVAITTHAGVSATGYEVDAARCLRVLGPGQRCKFTVRATELAIQRGERIDLTVFYDDPLTGQRRGAVGSSACGQR
ncbi:MAG TPA: choice-of-anchor D domain-containing protein [Thermoanaerobaculia bacterium]|nr:choice-of-anchor D domain-containing protein [Thermoanaerobaculia bacterium]